MFWPHSPLEDTSTAPTTSTHSTLFAEALEPRDKVLWQGCRPSQPRLARSQRPLTAQAAEKEQEDWEGVSDSGPWGNRRTPDRGTGLERAAAKRPRSSWVDRVPQSAGPDPAPRCGRHAASARLPPTLQRRGADPVPRPRGGLSRKSRPYVDVTDAARTGRGWSG